MKCEKCSHDFTPSPKGRKPKQCPECRKLTRRERARKPPELWVTYPPRPCANCSTVFTPHKKHQVHCSERCRDTAYMRRKRSKPEYAAKVRKRWADDAEFRQTRLETAKRWRARHPEKAKAAALRWKAEHADYLREYARRRREENPERVRQWQRDWWTRIRAERKKLEELQHRGGAKRKDERRVLARALKDKGLSLAQIARKMEKQFGRKFSRSNVQHYLNT
jgi:predicted nucleic acid-binding Zn ribbon protein